MKEDGVCENGKKMDIIEMGVLVYLPSIFSLNPHSLDLDAETRRGSSQFMETARTAFPLLPSSSPLSSSLSGSALAARLLASGGFSEKGYF